MKTHEEYGELLASLALDAVDDVERAEIERHVAQCPRCRSELDQFRDVAGLLGNAVDPLPDGLWVSIASQLHQSAEPTATPMPRLVRGASEPTVIAQSDVFSSGGASRRSRSITLVFAAAAAAIVIALSVSLASANGRVGQLQSALSARSAVAAALETPGHKIVNLSGASHASLAQFVMLPDGQGYLVSSTMADLASPSTYQLWAIVNGKPISVGIMGNSPSQMTFTMAGSPGPSALAVTVEPAGGSARPTSAVVASGTV